MPNVVVLGFEKIDAISQMVGSRSRQVILEELNKCELVCANCHVMRTVSPERRRRKRPD